MECNGRNSCTGNSRHVDIRYFFVKDRIDKGEFEVKHCPTESMLADFYTKPLQGTLFKKFRDVIMGSSCISSLQETTKHEKKERVENMSLNSGLFSSSELRAKKKSQHVKFDDKVQTYADVAKYEPLNDGNKTNDKSEEIQKQQKHF